MKAAHIPPSAALDLSGLEGYGEGFDLGARWASEFARWEDVKRIAAYAHSPWFRLTLDPAHSLVRFIAVELWGGRLPAAGVSLHREPLVEGLVAGAASVHDAIQSRARVH